MLELKYDKQLARVLGLEIRRLREVCSNAPDYYEEWDLHDPLRPDKIRRVFSSVGTLRFAQSRFYKRVLLHRLPSLAHSHGGVKGRSTKTNFGVHSKSRFVFKSDISDFYPSISQRRVYCLFLHDCKCPRPVAALCTQLCTYKRCLSQGLVTSPILANFLLQNVDLRIANLCSQHGLNYTRFVDDITVSGDFDLESSGIPSLVKKIVEEQEPIRVFG